jgi:hypothetical protein
MLDNQINEVEGKVKSETEKIKEMVGLIEKAPKEKKEKKEKKTAHEKGETKAEEKEEHEKEEPKKKSKDLEEASYKTSANSVEAQDLKKGDIITSGDEVVSVSAGAKTPSGKVEVTLKTKDGKTKTSVWGKTTKVGVKKDIEEARFEKGEDVGEKGKNFAKIAKSASKQYGSKEAGQKVAGAILKKVVAKENLDTNKVYGGTGQNQGATGSSLQFTVTEDTPEYFEIYFTLTPNSRHRPSGAGSRSAREKEYGYARISKKDFNGSITVKGENFYIGKDFITNNL